jgi:hygromycin-B 7''-O-kinase
VLSEEPLSPLNDIDVYRRHFMDVDLWRPYVEAVCRRHALLPCDQVRIGVPGSCPAFIVNERWVVKFFGRLFGGEESFQVERQANLLVAAEPAIPTPTLFGDGLLFEQAVDWPWPYLIIEFVPSVSIGEVYEAVRPDDLIQVARDLGVIVRRLHQLPLADTPPHLPTWQRYHAFLQELTQTCYARHREWGGLPEHLLERLDSYLLPPDQLIDFTARPHLIHADITADHILGRLEGDRWTTLALIDYGDAIVANLTYELIALHMDLFRCNKTLLHAFLDSYGLNALQRKALPRHAMSVTLLFEFDVLGVFFAKHRAVQEIATLEALAILLWDTDSPERI